MSWQGNRKIIKHNLVENAYLAATGQTGWQDFVQNFSPFPAVKLSLVEHNKDLTEFGTVIPHNFDPEFISSYIQHYYKLNPKSSLVANMLNNPNGVWGHQFINDKNFMNTEYYQDWLKPQGNLTRGFGYNFISSPTFNISLLSHVSADHKEEAEEIEQLMKEVGGHVSRAMLLEENLAKQQLRTNNYEQVLNCLHHPVILTNPDGKLHFANSRAEKMLSAGNLVSIDTQQILTFKDTEHDELAKKQLHNLTTDNSGNHTMNLRLKMPNNSFITLFASPVTFTPTKSDSFSSFWHVTKYIAWFFISPQILTNINAELLEKLLNVPPAQAELALNMLANKDLKQFSDERGVDITTARTQMRDLRKSTGTKSQVELMGHLTRMFGSFDL